MKQILRTAFYQLLVVYVLIIAAVALGFFWKYSLNLHIFALIVAILGIFILTKKTERKEEKGKKEEHLGKEHYALLAFGLLLIVVLRAIPYWNNEIPLGYDAGIYKYGIEHGLQNLDKWIIWGGLEPGFLYLMEFLKIFFSVPVILSAILIAISVLLGFLVYLATKELVNAKAALIALFLYAFSLIQFKAFALMYYKNIAGLCLFLLSVLVLKKSEYNSRCFFVLVLSSGFLAAMHRPSFYVFGLCYLLYAFISPYKESKYSSWKLLGNVLVGIAIVLFASLFYIGRFSPAVINMLGPVMEGFSQPGESPGTFINFFTYQFSALVYIPFALLGLFFFLRKKDLNFFVIWGIINLALVYFQFFFYNRLIIFLDIPIIILAAQGFTNISQDSKKAGFWIMLVLLFAAGIFALKSSLQEKPLVNSQELQVINYVKNTEKNSFVMAADSYYSPWVLGYSQRKTIAPGLFDHNKHNLSEWQNFWSTNSSAEIKDFLNAYNKPLYVFIGEKEKDNVGQFPECFSRIYFLGNNTLYKYTC